MNKLFIKIFLSFWLGLILFAGISLWLTSLYLENTRQFNDSNNPRQQLAVYIQQAQVIAKTQGQEGVKQWLKSLDNSEAIPYLLIDPNGVDMLGRTVPASISQRLQRFRYNSSRHTHSGDMRPQRQPVMIDDTAYRLVPDYQSVTLQRLLTRPRVVLVPILVATLISGFVGYLLTMYLTAPLSKLRLASRRLSRGDLNSRVAPSLGRRKDEIAELAEDFDHMAEKLQELLSSHKQLLQDTSHELRSPLARLQVALGLARQQCTPKELDRIELEADRLDNLIGQLLSLSRLDANIVQLATTKFSLQSLINSLVEDAQYEATTNNCRIEFSSLSQAGIVANQPLLMSAFENIIRNSLLHTGENTVIKIKLDNAPDSSDQYVIEISDEGPGVPESMLEKIFEPFTRVSTARERSSGGHGLGLAIAKRAILIHQGTIRAHNRKPNGLLITITLPSDYSAMIP